MLRLCACACAHSAAASPLARVCGLQQNRSWYLFPLPFSTSAVSRAPLHHTPQPPATDRPAARRPSRGAAAAGAVGPDPATTGAAATPTSARASTNGGIAAPARDASSGSLSNTGAAYGGVQYLTEVQGFFGADADDAEDEGATSGIVGLPSYLTPSCGGGVWSYCSTSSTGA